MKMRARRAKWHYDEQQPVFDEPGVFVAWVSGVHRGKKPNSVSSFGIEVREFDGERCLVDTRASVHDNSTHYRGVLGGIARVLEALAPSSNVTVVTNVEGVEYGLRPTRQTNSNEDIWQRIYEIIDGRQIRVTPRMPEVADHKIIEHLKKVAGYTAEAKLATLS
jgi:hypothetical protein